MYIMLSRGLARSARPPEKRSPLARSAAVRSWHAPLRSAPAFAGDAVASLRAGGALHPESRPGPHCCKYDMI